MKSLSPKNHNPIVLDAQISMNSLAVTLQGGKQEALARRHTNGYHLGQTEFVTPRRCLSQWLLCSAAEMPAFSASFGVAIDSAGPAHLGGVRQVPVQAPKCCRVLHSQSSTPMICVYGMRWAVSGAVCTLPPTAQVAAASVSRSWDAELHYEPQIPKR